MEDENDNPPVLLEPVEPVLAVRELQPAGTEVARLVASDPDSGENSELDYSLQTGDS